MKGKDKFSPAEINMLRELIKLRIQASEHGYKSAQKRIRDKMRDIGFYGGDDFGIHDMQLADLDRLIRSHQITVIGMPQLSTGDQISGTPPNHLLNTIPVPKSNSGRNNSDESYIIDLCDTMLGQKASRQHTFDFLRGDAGEQALGKKLPVDAYYPDLKLVIEYAERQHTEEVRFFDKPDKMTISGVSRGEQRKIYDQRRHQVLPAHGIKAITFSYEEFQHDQRKKLVRDKERDVFIIKSKLKSEMNLKF